MSEQDLAPEEQYDTSDKEAVNKAKKRSARTRSDRLEFIKAAMSLVEGRAWFYDFLLFTDVLGNPFNVDPYKTAFNLGQQNCGKRVLQDLQEAAPSDYMKMIDENKTKSKG